MSLAAEHENLTTYRSEVNLRSMTYPRNDHQYHNMLSAYIIDHVQGPSV